MRFNALLMPELTCLVLQKEWVKTDANRYVRVTTIKNRYIFGSIDTHSVWGKEQVKTDGCRYY